MLYKSKKGSDVIFIIKPEKTAIKNGYSKSTKLIIELLKNNNRLDVLDYGCGKLRNSIQLINNNFSVSILDTPLQINSLSIEYLKPFQNIYTTLDINNIKERYDIILCSYVLNVIPTYTDRVNLINNIYMLLKDDGNAFIEVRHEKNLELSKTKEPFNDGYILGRGSIRTFQKPYTEKELKEFIKNESSFKTISSLNNCSSVILQLKK